MSDSLLKDSLNKQETNGELDLRHCKVQEENKPNNVISPRIGNGPDLLGIEKSQNFDTSFEEPLLNSKGDHN